MCMCSVSKSCLALLQPHGWWPTRLLCPWDFPGKNTGNGLPFPSPGDRPDPGIGLLYPALQADCLPLSHQGRLWGIRTGGKLSIYLVQGFSARVALPFWEHLATSRETFLVVASGDCHCTQRVRVRNADNHLLGQKATV